MNKPNKPATTKEEVDIQALANDIVDAWDMDTLIEFAIGRLAQEYESMNSEDLISEHNEFYFPSC